MNFRAFSEARKLTTSTLMGVISQYRVNYDDKAGSVVLQQLWQQESTGMEKVNALVADEKRIIVGGFNKKQRGRIEIWKLEPLATPATVAASDPAPAAAEPSSAHAES